MFCVFIISDGSGLTAETTAQALLSRFPDLQFDYTALPFVDTPEKVAEAVRQIDRAAENGPAPLVFVTFVDDAYTAQLARARGHLFDLFQPFISELEALLGRTSSHEVRLAHGVGDQERYNQRIDALNYTLRCDDGLHPEDYPQADVILLGVSRSGKTPTSLYLALHFGLYTANYPLTDDDFETDALPAVLQDCQANLFGLTIVPERLAEIRTQRRPDSRYASLVQCRREVQQAQALFTRLNLPHFDSTSHSVEELGSRIHTAISLPKNERSD